MAKKMFMDDMLTVKRLAWSRMKAQAKFRSELWDISWEQFLEYWPDHKWLCRGKGSDDLVMSMKDPKQGWTTDNVEIITRRQQLAYWTRSSDKHWNKSQNNQNYK